MTWQLLTLGSAKHIKLLPLSDLFSVHHSVIAIDRLRGALEVLREVEDARHYL